MNLLTIAVIVLLIVFALWLVTNYLTEPFRRIITIFIVVLALIWIVYLIFPIAHVNVK